MIPRINILLSSVFILLIILGIDTEQANAKKPKWVKDRPVDQNYYIGIGKASKEKLNENYLEIAKNKALSDIISEISVNISSNSILYQIEDKEGLRETYQSRIQLATKEYIEGYELVDSWENKEEYWVYYRLSKAEYKRRKQEILDRAITLSKDFYEKAKAEEMEYDIHNALIYYIKSFDAIKNHIGEDLSVFTPEGKIYLDNAIYQSIQNILSRIVITPGKEIFTLKSLSSEHEPVYVKVKLKTERETQNLANVPIVFSYTKHQLSGIEEVITNREGIAECTKANRVPKGKNQILKAEFNIDSYFKESSEDNILKNIVLQNIIRPQNNIYIEVKELFAYLESDESIFGNQAMVQPITQILEEELSKNYFSFTDSKENADIIIKIESKIVKGTKIDKHNLHTAFLNCNISIINVKNNLVIFNDLINEKGMASGSYNAAAKNAIKKAKDDINIKLLPNIRNIKI